MFHYSSSTDLQAFIPDAILVPLLRTRLLQQARASPYHPCESKSGGAMCTCKSNKVSHLFHCSAEGGGGGGARRTLTSQTLKQSARIPPVGVQCHPTIFRKRKSTFLLELRGLAPTAGGVVAPAVVLSNFLLRPALGIDTICQRQMQHKAHATRGCFNLAQSYTTTQSCTMTCGDDASQNIQAREECFHLSDLPSVKYRDIVCSSAPLIALHLSHAVDLSAINNWL